MSGHSEQDVQHQINDESSTQYLHTILVKPVFTLATLCQATMNIELLVLWQAACAILLHCFAGFVTACAPSWLY